MSISAKIKGKMSLKTENSMNSITLHQIPSYQSGVVSFIFLFLKMSIAPSLIQ